MFFKRNSLNNSSGDMRFFESSFCCILPLYINVLGGLEIKFLRIEYLLKRKENITSNVTIVIKGIIAYDMGML